MTLLTSRKEIWKIIQKKVSKVFDKTYVNGLTYYDLLPMLKICNVFIEIGEDFSHSSSKMYAIKSSISNYDN